MSTADQAVRLRALLADLEGNRISAADAAAQVRTMQFPAMPEMTPSQIVEASADRDVPGEMPGSFREVARAYLQGRINLRQYEVLADAAVEAIHAQEGQADHPGHGESSAESGLQRPAVRPAEAAPGQDLEG